MMLDPPKRPEKDEKREEEEELYGLLLLAVAAALHGMMAERGHARLQACNTHKQEEDEKGSG
jgi:hypothetical protein